MYDMAGFAQKCLKGFTVL